MIKPTTICIFLFPACTIISVCVLLILVFLMALRRLRGLFVLHRLLNCSAGDNVLICRVSRSDIHTSASERHQPNTVCPEDSALHEAAAVAECAVQQTVLSFHHKVSRCHGSFALPRRRRNNPDYSQSPTSPIQRLKAAPSRHRHQVSPVTGILRRK